MEPFFPQDKPKELVERTGHGKISRILQEIKLKGSTFSGDILH